jgi:hypothetical protein
MIRQPSLPLILPADAALVTVEAARVLLSIDEDSVLALVDHGQLRWAWDIAVGQSRIREVRIWAQCVVARQQGAEQPGRDLASVVPDVIGVTTRTRLRASEVRALMCCSPQHIQRLVASGALDGDVEDRTRWVTRVSLEQFLTSRRIT